MEMRRPRGQIIPPVSHLPTWFLIIGYPVFWLQLSAHNAADGITAFWPWGLWLLLACLAYYFKNPRTLFNIALNPSQRYFWLAGLCAALAILGMAGMAGLKPIHLVQEFDCLQYHYTMPRQHLILGSFAHIPWSADDLFLMPLEFALAPFWFCTALPNKVPQLVFLLGLIGVVMRLTWDLDERRRAWCGPLIALLILGTHGFGIQMGTGMLDLAGAYLGLACLDSLRMGLWFLAGVELVFFFWSKPLMPLEFCAAAGLWGVFYCLARRCRWSIKDSFVLKDWKRALILTAVLSLVVGGPFVLKSIHYAGTPLFPLGLGQFGAGGEIKNHPQTWASLQSAAHLIVACKNDYGHGRGAAAFIKHFWLLAVPEKGVNNAYDYPLGLTYLLMIGPFLFYFIQDISKRRFSALGFLAVLGWILWWFTSQQSRFLYLPLLIIFMVTVARLDKLSKWFLICLVLALGLEAGSLWGAHKADFKRGNPDVLRREDRQLWDLSRVYLQHGSTGYVEWPSSDVAYAQFPVMVHHEQLPHTIEY